MMRGALLVGALHMTAALVTPPLFLIMAVSVQDVADLFSADAWRARFFGRGDDLLAIYAVYAGGLFVVAMGSLPPILIALLMGALGKLANISDIVAYATIVWVGGILLVSFAKKAIR